MGRACARAVSPSLCSMRFGRGTWPLTSRCAIAGQLAPRLVPAPGRHAGDTSDLHMSIPVLLVRRQESRRQEWRHIFSCFSRPLRRAPRAGGARNEVLSLCADVVGAPFLKKPQAWSTSFRRTSRTEIEFGGRFVLDERLDRVDGRRLARFARHRPTIRDCNSVCDF